MKKRIRKFFVWFIFQNWSPAEYWLTEQYWAIRSGTE